jgi:hypothetical protein
MYIQTENLCKTTNGKKILKVSFLLTIFPGKTVYMEKVVESLLNNNAHLYAEEMCGFKHKLDHLCKLKPNYQTESSVDCHIYHTLPS